MPDIESLYGDSPLTASALTPGQAEYDDGRAAAYAAIHGKKNPPYVRYPLTANTATMAASGLGTAALTGLALTAGTDLSVGKRWAASLGTGVLASIVAM